MTTSPSSELVGDAPLAPSGHASDLATDPAETPTAAVALAVLDAAPGAGEALVIAAGERRAEEIARALAALSDGAVDVLMLPAWDCLPYDRASPSREVMGRRMAVLQALSQPPQGRRITVVSPQALMQRLPADAGSTFTLVCGEPLDRDALAAFCDLSGYAPDDRVDEPGEVAFLGEVIDVFPADADTPVRVDLGPDDAIVALRLYDPVSQRSVGDVDRLVLRPASERLGAVARAEGAEHRPAEDEADLVPLLDRLGAATLFVEPDVPARCARFTAQVTEAYEAALAFGDADRPPAPERLYVALDAVSPAFQATTVVRPASAGPAPRFAQAARPGVAVRDWIAERQAQGRRIVVVGLDHELRHLSRMLARAVSEPPRRIDAFEQARSAEPGAVATFVADLDGGFDDPETGLAVLTPSDIVGGRIARPGQARIDLLAEPELRLGDVVIHEEHGLGVLEGLEAIETTAGPSPERLRLRYRDGGVVLAPIEDFSRIWRYGSEPSAVTLDRLGGPSWPRRRAALSVEIDAVAAALVEAAQARAAETAPPIVAPKAAYARFAAGFPFPESPDQAAAIAAVLEDLASGRPMNRLVCGDVGFGKTEVALRAAAAVALCGLQVVVAAPTTVLARQHYDTFRRRFDAMGLRVAHLSRLVDAGEAQAIKAGLASGEIHVVVGTQALAGDYDLAAPGLVIIDEEHRFGARLKDELGARAPHRLSLTATPIPRTLQGALVGVQEVSVIASPPARRRPIRTFLTPFDGGAVRTALLREKRRGGQSFVVVPRIEDLAPLRARLAELTPELHVVEAHGQMPADVVDAAMVAFAEGRGDVLLATNIVENGLDVPRANTMVILKPEHFGLAQLHQLRGRVGRGRRQGVTYLLLEPGDALPEATRARLATLEALDRLGSGFAISARDLDLRGGGTLLGDTQTGHVKLIGASLYQRVLARAVRAARGEAPDDLAAPQISLPAGGMPIDYVPDPAVRISLYARLAQAGTVEAVDGLAEEIEDRFGPPPEAVTDLLAHARLSALARAAGVTQLTAGPKATAFTVQADRRAPLQARLGDADGRRWSGDRLVVETNGADHDLAFMEALLSELGA